MSFMGMCMLWAQDSLEVSKDSFQRLNYEAIFDRVKNAGQDTPQQSLYLKAYLDKARMENNYGEMIQGYKNYLHRSKGMTRFTYADSMVLTAKTSGDVRLMGSAYLTKGILFYSEKKYKKALNNYLLADRYVARSDDNYLEYKLKYNIALVKYYTEHFDEALGLLQGCQAYFKGKSTPGYLNTLLLLGRCHQRMKNYGLSSKINRLGLMEGKRLGSNSLAIYFVQSEGINHAMEGNYSMAIAELDSSFRVIRNTKNDFANVVLSAYYLGKCYWGVGQREKAVDYFKKVDVSFRERNYMKAELLGTYKYLTEYFATLNNQELRFFYLKKHIEAIDYMRSQSQYLDDTIKDGYDLKGIQREKQRIEQLLVIKERRQNLGITVVIVLFVLLVWLTYKYQHARKIYQKRFEAIINGQGPPLKQVGKAHVVPSQPLDISKGKIDAVLSRLEHFEGNRNFLDPKMSVSKLAVIAEVNGKYLSQIITHYKGKRVMEYINDLRVDHIIDQMKQDRKLAYYSNGSLAEVAGFNSERAFTNAFKSRLGITPMFFMERLKAEGVPE